MSQETEIHIFWVFLFSVLFDDGQQLHIRGPEFMTQTQQLQASSASSWPAQKGVPEVSPKSTLPANYDREKYRSTGFFVRSTIAGGIAGCTVYIRYLIWL